MSLHLISGPTCLKEIPTWLEAATSIHDVENNIKPHRDTQEQSQICAFGDLSLTHNGIRLHRSLPSIVHLQLRLFYLVSKAIPSQLYSGPSPRLLKYKYTHPHPPEDLLFSIIRFIPNPTSLQQSFRFSKAPNLSQWLPSRAPLLSRVSNIQPNPLRIHQFGHSTNTSSSPSIAGPGGGCVVM